MWVLLGYGLMLVFRKGIAPFGSVSSTVNLIAVPTEFIGAGSGICVPVGVPQKCH